MNPAFKDYLLKATRSSAVEETELIQSLWSGYGTISRYRLRGSSRHSVVVKHVSPNTIAAHPRGWDTDFAHNRKVRSYQVETTWYEQWNQRCQSNCRTPQFLGSFSEGKDRWIILEDLDLVFSERRTEVTLPEVKVCLKWLANFHANFLGQEPVGLWEVGTYWHLNARPEEYERIEHEDLRSKAHKIDEILSQCQYQAIVHGDAKLANFCFSKSGEDVAAVDFQYVGGGCGMKDVAYFLGSCLSSDECENYEKELLDFYFSELNRSIQCTSINIDFSAMEKEWRDMYSIACADFIRFLLGWMPSHQKVNSYNLGMMKRVLETL